MITELEAEALSGARALRTLRLARNLLRAVPASALAPLAHLQSLSVPTYYLPCTLPDHYYLTCALRTSMHAYLLIMETFLPTPRAVGILATPTRSLQ